MFRQLLLTVFIICAIATYSVPSGASFLENEMHFKGDDRWTHWPWRLVQPFPWSDIQGVWKVQDGEYVSYFAFRKISHQSGVKQLSVKQLDTTACTTVARGVGIERGSFIYAQMTGMDGGIYRLNLSQFKCSDSPLSPAEQQGCKNSMMVLSMGELSAQNLEQMFHMRIKKISSEHNSTICLNKN